MQIVRADGAIVGLPNLLPSIDGGLQAGTAKIPI